MIAHAWFTAAALAAAPVPTSPADDALASPADDALALYDKGAFLAAAEAAIAEYLAPTVPTTARLRSARLAQEALRMAYEASLATRARPELLCRALDVLDATALLAVTAEDLRLHTKFAAQHRDTLTRRHPGHTCEPGTELRPIDEPARGVSIVVNGDIVIVGTATVWGNSGAARPAESPAPTIADAPRKPTVPASLKIAGTVTLGLGVAALAVMVGGLGIRSQAANAARSLDVAQEQQGGVLTPEQAQALAPLSAADESGRQVALAGGISGAVLLLVGAALVGRGHILATRARVSAMTGRGQAGIFVHGRF